MIDETYSSQTYISLTSCLCHNPLAALFLTYHIGNNHVYHPNTIDHFYQGLFFV